MPSPPKCSPSSPPISLFGYPCSPRRSCPHKQQLAYYAGHYRCTELQGSCYWAWEMAPGEQEEVAQCCCFCHLRVVRWLSTRHHIGQSDLYCWTLDPKKWGVGKSGFANLSFSSFYFTLVHLEANQILHKTTYKMSLSNSRKLGKKTLSFKTISLNYAYVGFSLFSLDPVSCLQCS